MSFGFEAPEDTQIEGGFISGPGTYHVIETDMKEDEVSNGNAYAGAFTFSFDTLAGTDQDNVGKSGKETLFSPQMNDEDWKKEKSSKQLASYFIATDVMTPDQLGKQVNIELQDTVNRQFMVRLKRKREKDENGNWVDTPYLQLDGTFHVDDPAMADIPKNEEALAMIPAELRHDASYFAFKAKKNGKPAPVQSSASPAMADALDDI